MKHGMMGLAGGLAVAAASVPALAHGGSHQTPWPTPTTSTYSYTPQTYWPTYYPQPPSTTGTVTTPTTPGTSGTSPTTPVPPSTTTTSPTGPGGPNTTGTSTGPGTMGGPTGPGGPTTSQPGGPTGPGGGTHASPVPTTPTGPSGPSTGPVPTGPSGPSGGPGPTSGRPTGPGGPGAGGRSSGGSSSGQRARAAREAKERWEEWWWFNQWRFVRSDAHRATTTHGSGKSMEEGLARFLRETGLGDSHFDPRSAAAVALGKLRATESRDDLESRVKDAHEHAFVRESAALALGMMGASASAPLLVRVAADPSQETRLRVHATIGLGMLRDASATGKLLSLLARPDEVEVQVAAAMALGLVGDATAADALARLSESAQAPDPVRSAAVSALGKVGAASAAGRPLVTLLARRLLSDGTDDVRRAAALVLRRSREDEALTALDRAARQDRDVVTRGFAMLSLAEVVHGRGIAEERRAARGLLERALRLGSDREFGYAAIALGLLGRGDAACAAPLRSGFEAASTGSDRAACAVALGLLGDVGSCKRIADAVSEEGLGPDARGYCCVALGLLGRDDPGVASFLRELVEKAHVPELRAAASLALAKLGDRTAIPTLRRAIEDRNRYFQMSATIALGYFRDPDSVKDLVAHFRHESNPEARAITLVALGYIGDRGTLPALRELALDFDYLVACDRLPAVDQILRLF